MKAMRNVAFENYEVAGHRLVGVALLIEGRLLFQRHGEPSFLGRTMKGEAGTIRRRLQKIDPGEKRIWVVVNIHGVTVAQHVKPTSVYIDFLGIEVHGFSLGKGQDLPMKDTRDLMEGVPMVQRGIRR